MNPSLKITVHDPDPDYLGIEIAVASERFAGTTRIYAGIGDLSAFASNIEGFPTSPSDERVQIFGSQEHGIAGGYARFRFYCFDASGSSGVQVTIEDDDQWHTAGSASFEFQVYAAALDQFVARLRAVESQKAGEAILGTAV